MTSITKMIRLDHTHVMATFHKYEPDLPPRVKKGLIDTICLAVEVHAQLEEEIFYPALRDVTDNEVLRKSGPEHYEMKQLIGQLRNMTGSDPQLDRVFYQLMQQIIHHVADEETVLLPEAERLLADQLSALGMQMTRRRIELTAPRTPQMASSMARSMSGGKMALAAGLVLIGGLLVAKRRPLVDVVRQAQRDLHKRRLMATLKNMLPGHKSLATKVLAR